MLAQIPGNFRTALFLCFLPVRPGDILRREIAITLYSVMAMQLDKFGSPTSWAAPITGGSRMRRPNCRAPSQFRANLTGGQNTMDMGMMQWTNWMESLQSRPQWAS